MPERKPWTEEEDQALKYLRQQVGINKWSMIAHNLASQYNMHGRTGKQCRERYHNHLDSSIMHAEWTREQQLYMYKLHDELGNKWAIISQKLHGRTDNCVKNHFYSKLRKAIRKLNKVIHDCFRKQFKEIKITILYKIIQAADQKFKSTPSIDEQISETCNKLKKKLLQYSYDEENQFQDDLPKLKALIKSIYEFSGSYRRKPKRCRKSSAHANDFLKVPKFEKKIKSSSDHEESEEEGEYSFLFSHSSHDKDNSEDEEEMQIPKEKILEDAIEEEKDEKEEEKKCKQYAKKQSIESEKMENIDDILFMNEGRISLPIPFIRRASSLRSENHSQGGQKTDMFCNYVSNVAQLMGEMNFSSNLNDDGDMDDEDKLFQNI